VRIILHIASTKISEIASDDFLEKILERNQIFEYQCTVFQRVDPAVPDNLGRKLAVMTTPTPLFKGSNEGNELLVS
jgi:hypothetical protein